MINASYIASLLNFSQQKTIKQESVNTKNMQNNDIHISHLSGCCCMWKVIFALRYLGAAADVIKQSRHPVPEKWIKTSNNYRVSSIKTTSQKNTISTIPYSISHP